MQSRVICNSLCGVRVTLMEERPLMVSGRKITNRIRDTNTAHGFNQSTTVDISILYDASQDKYLYHTSQHTTDQ